jgi:ribose transport system permease protein
VYLLWQELGMVVVLVILCVFMALFAPYFLTASNLLNVAQQSSINAILAAGMTLVILTGGIDLSVGSGLAVAGVAAVWLASKGVPGIVDVLVGLVVGSLCGLLNGV